MAIRTEDELFEALKSLSNPEEDEDSKKYRYILYCRRSTDEKDKQVYSLPDQYKECKEYADEHDLIIAKVIQEKESAKESGTRPKFREMMNLLEAGRYDGILAWHPDRLARNMKDAGEIIDLVDKRTIKDLKFASFNFDNSSGGKMHLGITFVLSKHYSDHLSESVNRGNRSRIAEGKYINRPIYGYIKDQNQHLIPDTHNDNFILIKTAFKMRLEGKTLDEIADYLNENNLSITRTNKKKGLQRFTYKMTKQRVSSFMRNPIYTGILSYGKSGVANLIKQYGFHPMLNVEEFMKINKLSNNKELIRLARNYRKGEDVKASLMREMVICSQCGEFMTAGITPKPSKGGIKRYFYFRCDNENCERKGKSTRAKVIMDYIYDYLEQKPFSFPESYVHYKEEMKRVSEQRLIEARRNKRSLEGQKQDLERKIETIKDMLSGTEEEEIKKLYRDDLKPTHTNIKEIEEKIDKLKTFIKAGEVSILAHSEFVELMENMPKIMRKMKKMNDLDFVVRKTFLNFVVEQKKVIKSTLNSPFDALETPKVSDCARGET